MSFDQELQAICEESPGSRLALVMSLDGIGVASHQSRDGDLDAEVLMIELVASLKMAAKALASANAGELDTVELASPKGTLLVDLLRDEHFVALYLDPDAIIGRGRYALRRHHLALNLELS